MADQNNLSKENETKPSEEFAGFNIKINEFGEVICSHNIDDINQYLDVNVEDKKLNPDKDKSAK